MFFFLKESLLPRSKKDLLRLNRTQNQIMEATGRRKRRRRRRKLEVRLGRMMVMRGMKEWRRRQRKRSQKRVNLMQARMEAAMEARRRKRKRRKVF
tara:strand:+ start:734 stop:1021 length:288 start_codon:yes stop_codon:yes gene_type:complete